MSFFSSIRGKKKPKPKVAARARGKKVDGQVFADRRSVPMPQPKKALPQHVKDQYDALMIVAGGTRAELAILRQTRGKRNVGALKVPPHLAVGEILDDRGGVDAAGQQTRPEKRGDAAAILPPRE